ncbi:MAG: serine/threonine protein kinase [Polyangiales bacterium]|jgi:serine/threonine protein kinase
MRDFETIFSSLELDKETLEMAYGDTILPTQQHREDPPPVHLTSITMEEALAGQDVDFRIVETLGEGSMGVVSLAEQTSLQRLVAVKAPKGDSPTSRGRMINEALFMGRVEHPNVVPAYGLGQLESGQPILVMKRVQGTSWDAVLTGAAKAPGSGDADLTWHLRVLMQVCNAVRFAHARRVVHRDIKPENVMIGEFGEVYLLDWGIALSLEPGDGGLPRATNAHSLAGTPLFMAPEMTGGDTDTIDERTDIYLLGANLHMVLTGSPPHAGDTIMNICKSAYLSTAPEYGDDVPGELADIARKAMARDKQDRWGSVEEFSAAISDYLEHRASFQLSDAAENMLKEAADHPGSDEETTHLVEAEFGFRQALLIWADNMTATLGLQSTIEKRVRASVAGGELSSARGALERLPSPNAELEALVVQLDKELKARAARVDYLERFERELDLSTSARSRQKAVVLLGAFLVLLCFSSAWGSRPGQPGFDLNSWMTSYWRILGVAAIPWLLFWRKLTANVANRRLMTYFASSMVAVFVVRFSGVRLEVPQLHLVVVEVCIMGIAAAAIGIATSPRLAALSSCYAVAGLVSTFSGEMWIAYISFGLAHLVFFSSMAVIWRPRPPKDLERADQITT